MKSVHPQFYPQFFLVNIFHILLIVVPTIFTLSNVQFFLMSVDYHLELCIANFFILRVSFIIQIT